MKAARSLQKAPADSLLQFAYAFTSDFIIKKRPLDPPFPIPQLHFVKGAIAYLEKSLDDATKLASLISHHTTYLLEALLPMDQQFIKYIHNADAVPLQECDKLGYEFGVFLCFIWHVQFMCTHGQAYISNFQGL